MKAVADTGPLNYLLLIEEIGVLPQLFKEVVIPNAVREEMLHANAPEAVRQWAETPPGWITIIGDAPGGGLQQLGAGEHAAIWLAESLSADAVLLDDAKARAVAEAKGLSVIGTLGILASAADLSLLDLPEVFRRLEQTTFRAPTAVMTALLERDAARRSAEQVSTGELEGTSNRDTDQDLRNH